MQVEFSLQIEPYCSNFAGVIPLLYSETLDDVAVGYPWHGKSWESNADQGLLKLDGHLLEVSNLFQPSQTLFDRISSTMIRGPSEKNNVFAKTHALFRGTEGTSVFYALHNIVKPFLHKYAEDDSLVSDINIASYLSLFYGHYVHIGHTHVCIGDQTTPLILVEIVLRIVFAYFPGDVDLNTVVLKDLFLQLLCFAIHTLDQDTKTYREDIFGEDINIRFGFFSEKKNKKNLYDGGDCEDWTQTLFQFLYTIQHKFASILQMFPEKPILLHSILKIEAYISRGIYRHPENHVSEHHTFCVSQHEHECAGKHKVSLSIIECISPFIMVPRICDVEFLSKQLSARKAYTGKPHNIHIISHEHARDCYRYIFWLETYMVYVYRKDTGHITFGAQCYTQYDDSMKITTERDIDVFKQRKQTLASGETILLMIIPNTKARFFGYFCTLSHDHNRANLDELAEYWDEMDVMIEKHIKPLYNEDTDYVEKYCQSFLQTQKTKYSCGECVGIFSMLCASTERVTPWNIHCIQTAGSMIIAPIVLNNLKLINMRLLDVIQNIDTVTLSLITNTASHEKEAYIQQQITECLHFCTQKKIAGDIGQNIDSYLTAIAQNKHSSLKLFFEFNAFVLKYIHMG